MSVLPAYVYVYNVYALEVKEGNLELQLPAMWMLEITPGSPGKTAIILTH